jgi:5,10-methylenetetrahydromethanopterin reductase
MSGGANDGRVGIRFEGFETLADAARLAVAAEAAGASSVWVTQHLGGRDIAVLATHILAVTSRIRVVPSNVSPFIAHPTTTAMMLATLAELVPGRIAASIGIGNAMDLGKSGAAPEAAEDAVCDFVAGVEALLGGAPVERTGRTYRLAGAKVTIPPKAKLPLYVTALEPGIARRAGEIGAALQLSAGFAPPFAAACVDAWKAGLGAAAPGPCAAFAYFGTDAPASREGVRRKLAYLFRNRLMAENLRLSGLPIDQPAIMAAIAANDLDAATRLVPDAAIDAFAVTGDTATCRATLARFFSAGVDEVLINVGTTDAEMAAALALIRAVNG